VPIPDYQSLMLPILQALADQQGHALAQIRAQIASRLQLSHTPEESLARSYQRQRDALGTELLDAIAKSAPAAFEGLVVDLLMATGYGGDQENAGWVVGRSGDGGIDGFPKRPDTGEPRLLVRTVSPH
jgi:restriction endonuclease Mrr